MSISTIILTYNEELHIARCIRNAFKVSMEVFVIDCFSTDHTREIAEKLGAKVIEHEYINQAQQFQWALDNVPCKGDWVLRLDADEYLTNELITEIQEKLPLLNTEVTGVYLSLSVVFLGKRLRFGKLHTISILRLWRRGGGIREQRWMDGKCKLISGRSGKFKHEFIDENLNSLTWWIQKHNNYSSRELIAEVGKHFDKSTEAESISCSKKKDWYYRLPAFLRAFAYFVFRYFILLGFLDGKAGLIWAFLQAFWYRFLVDAKIYELHLRLGDHPTSEEIDEYFQNYLGLKNTFHQKN